MKREFKVLLLEDNRDDALLVEREMKKGGLRFVARRAENKEEFIHLLRDFEPEIVLSDYWLKEFDGLSALRLTRVLEIDVPFILITGSTNEEVAVECIKAGAADYILKDRMARLPAAVRAVLDVNEVRAEKQQVEEKLKEGESRLRHLSEYMLDLVSQVDPDLRYVYASASHKATCGYEPTDLVGKPYLDLVHPDDHARIDAVAHATWLKHTPTTTELRFRSADGSYRWFEVAGNPVMNDQGAQTGVVLAARDITERRLFEENIRRQQTYLSYLSESAMTFVDFPADENLYQFIGERLRLIIGNAVIIVNSFDPESQTMRTESVVGEDSMLKRLLSTLGKDPVGAVLAPDEELLGQLMLGRLVSASKGLRHLAIPNIPKMLSGIIGSFLEVRGVYAIGLVQKDHLLGSIILVARQESLDVEQAVIETFASQASVALQRHHAETLLKESEVRYRRLIETSPDGILLVDLEARILDANPRALQLLSRPDMAAARNHSLMVAVHREDQPAVISAFARSVQEGAVSDLECRLNREDGVVVWAEVLFNLIPRAEGRREVVMVVMRDVSARRTTDDALKDSEQRFRELTDLLPQPVFEANLLGRISFANRSALETFQYDEGTVRSGLNIGQMIAPADRERAVRAYQGFIAGSGRSGNEFMAQRRDGSTFPVMIYSSIVRRKNEIVGIRGIIVDITERKASEAALRSSEERHRMLVEQANDGIVLSDIQSGIILEANERSAELAGTTVDRLVGSPMSQLYPEAESARHRESIRLAVEQGSSVATDLHVLRKDGMTTPVEISTRAFMLNGRRVLVSVVRDLTDRLRASTVEEDAERRLGAILNNAPFGAHMYELRQDGDLVFTAYNPAADQILGFDHRNVLGKTIGEAFPPLLETEIPSTYARIAREGGLYTDNQLSYEGGQIRGAFEIHAFQTGERKMVVFFRDIGERIRVEDELRRNEEKFRTVVEQSSDGFTLVDERGLILEWNPAIESLTNLQRTDVMGKSFVDVLLGVWSIGGKDADRRREQIKRIFGGAVDAHVSRLYNRPFNLKLELPSSERRFAELRVFPVRTAQGTRIGAIVRDMTAQHRLDEAVLASERLTRYIVEHNPLEVAVFDREMRYLMASKSFLKNSRLDENTYLGRSHYELVPDIPEVWRGVHQRCLAGAVESSDGEPYERTDGSIGYSRWECRPWHDANGTIGGIVLYAEDITERKRVEEQHRKLSLAIEQSPSTIMITDRQGNLEYVNPRFCEVTGYSREEVIGKNPRFLKSGLTQRDDYRVLWETIAAGKEWKGEFLNRRKNNELFFESAMILPIRDERGALTHFLAVKEDITGRKRMEQSLKQSEERYRTFFEEDLAGAFIARFDGSLQMCNPAFAQVFGYPDTATAQRQNLFALIPDPAYKGELDRRLREEKKVILQRVEGRRSDGKRVLLLQSVSATFNEKGEIVEIKGFIIDTTEERLGDEQQRQSQKMDSLGALAGGIAHDFNNILNNVLGFAGQLKKYATDPAKVQRYGDTIEKSALRGAELATNLLMITRQKKRELVPMNLRTVVGEVERTVRNSFPANIAVTFTVDAELFDIKGEQGSLFQLVLNLCLNAQEAMPAGGSLTVDVCNRKVGEDMSPKLLRQEAQYGVEIKASDTGEGIPADLREKIFEPFFSTRGRGKGTGMGLAIVFNVARDHGGSVVVESEEQKGTVMSVYLPALEEQSSLAHPGTEAPARRSNNELVLLVDDELTMQELGRELLEDVGFRVLIASDGTEAVDLYKQHNGEIALVILDLIMPKMDGGQTFVELKKIDRNVRAVFCSGYTSEKVITDLLKEEHLRAIQKPFHPADFVRIVQEVIAET